MAHEPRQYNALARLLHWLMAALVLTVLAIGMTMVSSLGNYHWLISIHRPLGILILLLVVVRFANRLVSRRPPLPVTMSAAERLVATASEYLLYALMFALPLVGWMMLSAARYPIVLFGSVHLPYILPHDAMLHAMLRRTHTVLAYALLAAIVAHFSAVLFHTLIVRDGLLGRMAPWKIRDKETGSTP